MVNPRGRNQNLVKSHNLSAILLRLLQEGLISRVELTEYLGLSSTTITNLTAELLQKEIIVEEEVADSGKQKRVGRPRRMLRLVPDARYVIGVHIGVGMFRVALTNLFAEIVNSIKVEFDLSAPAEEVVSEIAQRVEEVIDASGVEHWRVIGVGVGASGLVNFVTGVNIYAPRLGWRDVHIKHLLQEKLDMLVCVDNNTRTMALGEAFFGAGREVDSLAFVYGRVGVGAGLVVDHMLFHGSNAGAGEIGHTVILPEEGEFCSCGNRGCLETLISEPAIIKQAQILAEQSPDSLLNKVLNRPNGSLIERIIEAGRAGDHIARDLFINQACYLGIALANLVNVLNPQMIILGGMFSQAGDLIIPTVEEKMRELSFDRLGENVHLMATSFGWRAGVIGAASLALITFFYQQDEFGV
jgi:glucokinase-like ROK family protein